MENHKEVAHKIREHWRLVSDKLRENIRREKIYLIDASIIYEKNVKEINNEIAKYDDEYANRSNQLQSSCLTKDTLTVKEVAEICKKFNPKTTLRETNDEIPNLGFSLSNKKLLKAGFKFLY